MDHEATGLGLQALQPSCGGPGWAWYIRAGSQPNPSSPDFPSSIQRFPSLKHQLCSRGSSLIQQLKLIHHGHFSVLFRIFTQYNRNLKFWYFILLRYQNLSKESNLKFDRKRACPDLSPRNRPRIISFMLTATT